MADDAPEDPTRRLWWIIPVATILLLISLVVVFGGPEKPPGYGTSYDASRGGFRALYLVLEELKVPVTRSRRQLSKGVRWVLFPGESSATAQLKEWVQDGGNLLLADVRPDFARGLGMDLQVTDDATPTEQDASGFEARRIVGGAHFVTWAGRSGQVLAEAGGKPLITTYEMGRGTVWLVNRPDMLSNRQLHAADNAILAYHVARAMLAERPGELAFDEFVHGLRDRPGIFELLLTPPALWVTLQGGVVLGLLLWHAMPRFGNLKSAAPPPRRSKQEFVDAMAWLLERKGDYAQALATVRTGALREVERALGLPPGTPVEQLLAEVQVRRPERSAALRRLAAPPHAINATTFIHAMNELETARREFFHS